MSIQLELQESAEWGSAHNSTLGATKNQPSTKTIRIETLTHPTLKTFFKFVTPGILGK